LFTATKHRSLAIYFLQKYFLWEVFGRQAMSTYPYRCVTCGPFDVRRPIGEALPEEPCRTCEGRAKRIFTVPMLNRTPIALARALRAQEASAHQPRVVGELPATRRRSVAPADPRHAQLPKP
jgi:putative FmdB family regulatory protein